VELSGARAKSWSGAEERGRFGDALLIALMLVGSLALFAPVFIFPLRSFRDAASCRSRVYLDPITSRMQTMQGASIDASDALHPILRCGGQSYRLLPNHFPREAVHGY
jgi:hypothetical protein